MPWLMDVKYFMYNKDMLAKAGFNAPPTTWEELIDQAKAIKDKRHCRIPDHLVLEPEGRRGLRLHRPAFRERRCLPG